MHDVRILSAGEQGIVVEFGCVISAKINALVHFTARQIAAKLGDKVLEVVPTYRSLLVYFNPLLVDRQDLIVEIKGLIGSYEDSAAAGGNRLVHIPVCYGGEFGPDIEFVASHNRLTVKDVIDIHSSTAYLVYMLGFTPGFPYLGGMSEKIAAPRLTTPRTSIPAGSVGIAGSQTGFYPISSPGGWRLIGRTPVKAFDKDGERPFLFEAGDYLKFEPITSNEYCEIEELVRTGQYRPVITVMEGGNNS